jgi:hypothetical protein
MKKELQKLATIMLLSMMWPQLTSGQTQVARHDASSNQASKAPETTTIYQLTDQLEAGGEYLIVNTNEAGDGVALGHNETAITSNDVEIYSNDENLYIKADDVNTTSVWTASEKGEHMKLTNDVYILQIPYNTNYKIYAYKNDESFDGSWVYQDDYLQYTYINKNKKRVTYTVVYNDGYKFANNKESKVYLYKKVEGPASTQKAFDLTISDAGWATLYLDYAVTIPDGLSKVFYINSIVDDVAKGTTVTGVIPPLTGVIIQGNAGTYQFKENSSNVEAPTDNLLTGTLEDIDDASTHEMTKDAYGKNLYTLGRTNSGNVQLALFKGKPIGKNKAFLITKANTNSSHAKAFSVVTDSGATAIHAMDDVESDHKAWYTLQGIRLNGKPTKKGVYIHGGKRIYVK